jgi:hypothetical protein
LERIGLALAVHDFVPVLVAGVGLWRVTVWLSSRNTSAGRAAASGTALVVAAGVAKAGSKLAAALTGGSPPAVLDAALFPLMAPGMSLMAVAVLSGLSTRRSDRAIATLTWAVPVAVWAPASVVAVWNGWAGSKVLLIAITTIGNVVLCVALAHRARAVGLRLPAALFMVNLGVVVALAGLARAVEQTVPVQWVEQNVNLAAQLAFLVAATGLMRARPADQNGRSR